MDHCESAFISGFFLQNYHLRHGYGSIWFLIAVSPIAHAHIHVRHTCIQRQFTPIQLQLHSNGIYHFLHVISLNGILSAQSGCNKNGITKISLNSRFLDCIRSTPNIWALLTTFVDFFLQISFFLQCSDAFTICSPFFWLPIGKVLGNLLVGALGNLARIQWLSGRFDSVLLGYFSGYFSLNTFEWTLHTWTFLTQFICFAFRFPSWTRFTYTVNTATDPNKLMKTLSGWN